MADTANATISTRFVLDRIATLLVDQGHTTEARDFMTDVRDHSEGVTLAQAEAITTWRRSISAVESGWTSDDLGRRVLGDQETLRQAESTARLAALDAFAPADFNRLLDEYAEWADEN